MTTRTRPLTSLIADGCRVLARRVRAVFHELDYAQRRMLEIRTGYVFTPEERARRAHAEVRRLERLLDEAPSERRRQ
jgi:hypothetical protein